MLRKPHSASVGAIATSSSGLWLASLYERSGAVRSSPRASSSANPAPARSRLGVRLEGQRLLGGEQLDQERQVGLDVGEAAPVGQRRRLERVRAHPDLGPGLVRILGTEQAWQDRARAPRVVPDGGGEQRALRSGMRAA